MAAPDLSCQFLLDTEVGSCSNFACTTSRVVHAASFAVQEESNGRPARVRGPERVTAGAGGHGYAREGTNVSLPQTNAAASRCPRDFAADLDPRAALRFRVEPALQADLPLIPSGSAVALPEGQDATQIITTKETR